MPAQRTLASILLLFASSVSGAADEPPASAEQAVIRPAPEFFRAADPGPPPAAAADPALAAEVGRSARDYRDSGRAPVIHRSTYSVFPFDQSQPTVQCSPLRACDIQLQQGEVVRGVAVGDTDRWIAQPLMSGEADSDVPHVIVKPKEYGLDTNLVIGTTRRTYHLRLLSPPSPDGGNNPVLEPRHVAFYYPDELVATWASAEELRRRQQVRRDGAMALDLAAPSLAQLNFDYAVRSRKPVSWAPVTVFDDGEHVYIQLPTAALAGDLPALLVEVEGGGLGVSNYRVQDRWYVVDGLFPRAELVLGVGGARRKVEILNRALRGRGQRHGR